MGCRQRLQSPIQRLLRGVEAATQENSEGHRNPHSTPPFPVNLVLLFNDPSFFVVDSLALANQFDGFLVSGWRRHRCVMSRNGRKPRGLRTHTWP